MSQNIRNIKTYLCKMNGIIKINVFMKVRTTNYSRYLTSLILLFMGSVVLSAQNQGTAITDSASIDQCLSYALKNQPLVRQLNLDEAIADQTIRISLSDWLPKITATAGYQDYLKRPVAFFPNTSDPTGPDIQITTGLKYNSSLLLNGTQNIFTPDLYFAGRTSKYYRQQVKQTTKEGLIQLVVDVSKAFYDVLLSEQMLNIIDEDIDRLTTSLRNAESLYKNGTTDKIDYKRATIALNNAKSQKTGIENSIKSKKSVLRQLMNYPEDKPLNLKYNFNAMKNDVLIDTLQQLHYNDRIEYQLLQTNVTLQKLSLDYNRFSFLPSLSGYANYNLIYQNASNSSLYDMSFPNSSIGLTLSFPLLEGTRKWHNIRKARLTYERLVLDTLNLKNELNTGYAQAMAEYKSNLAAYNVTTENISIARDVYNTVMFQYNQGIKTYLDVIISETDLLTAELNNLSSMILLMFSKIDVQQATGKISVEY
jgi:outer membrane protein